MSFSSSLKHHNNPWPVNVCAYVWWCVCFKKVAGSTKLQFSVFLCVGVSVRLKWGLQTYMHKLKLILYMYMYVACWYVHVCQI